MTKCALKNGDIAVATLRTPSDLDALRAEYPSSDKLLIIKLDVTKPEEISSAFKEVKDKLGRIDYVFNNAGYPVVGEIEGVKEVDARAMFEVNFWGAMNVAKEALEFFREVNKPQGGYLLNISSTAGLAAKPPTGWYAASKHGKHPSHTKVRVPIMLINIQLSRERRSPSPRRLILSGTSRYILHTTAKPACSCLPT